MSLLFLTSFGIMVQTKKSSKKLNSNKMVTEVNNYVHFHGAPAKGKILMVASSPSVSKQTQWPIGFWAAELTHPLRVFQEAGYEVVDVGNDVYDPVVVGTMFTAAALASRKSLAGASCRR